MIYAMKRGLLEKTLRSSFVGPPFDLINHEYPNCQPLFFKVKS